MASVLIAGFGATGLACGRLMVEAGHTVTALARSARLAREASDLGIALHIGDIAWPESFPPLPEPFDTIVVAAATKASDVPRDPWALYVDGHRRFAQWIQGRAQQPRLVIVLGNTGVYGPSSRLPDGTIDETSPLDNLPKRDRAGGGTAMRRNESVASDEMWRATPLPWLIVRVPGIRKGDDRAYEAMIANPGWRPPAEDRTYQTIRLESLARVVAFLMERGEPREVYNATPPAVSSVVRRARPVAERLGLAVAWPAEADLARHALIRPLALERLGYRLTAEDG